MRKLLSLIMIAGMVTLFACGNCEDHDHDHDKDAEKKEAVQAEEQAAPEAEVVPEEEQDGVTEDTTAVE